MIRTISEYFPEETWQEIATEAENLVQEFVDERSQIFGELKRRFVKLKLGHLKLRLARLKQNLQQQLEIFETRLHLNRDDEEARSLHLQGTERLADMWLTESLLDRLAKSSTGDRVFSSTNNILYQTPSSTSDSSSSNSSSG